MARSRTSAHSALHALLALLCAATLLAGCNGATTSNEAPEFNLTDEETAATEDALAPPAQGEAKSAGQETQRVVIRNASISLRSRDYDGALTAIKDVVSKAKGNITSSSESGGQRRSITIEARVDPAKLEETVEQLRGIEGCTVESANISADDVTRTYNDTERRIEILNEQYEHYKKMLDEAQTTEDMLLISDRMYDVMAEIKSYTDSRDDMKHNAEHSLLSITLREETAAGETSSSSQDNFFLDAWDDSWGIFGKFVRTALYLLILLLPYLLIGLLILGIVVLVHRGRKKRLAKKEEESQDADSES